MGALKAVLKLALALVIIGVLAQVAKLLAGRGDDESSASFDAWPDVPHNPAES